jgi:RNA-directed DNA polymerase
MEVSYVEDLANHNDPESCVITGNCVGEALTGGDAGQVLSREKLKPVRGADAVDGSGRQNRAGRNRETGRDPARSETLSMHPSTPRGSREMPRSAEQVAGRGLAKGNSVEQNRDRAQDREALQSALDRIRQAARKVRFAWR